MLVDSSFGGPHAAASVVGAHATSFSEAICGVLFGIRAAANNPHCGVDQCLGDDLRERTVCLLLRKVYWIKNVGKSSKLSLI